jgi:hypothetical protein
MKSDISVEQVAFFLFSVLVSCFVHHFRPSVEKKKISKTMAWFIFLTYQKQKDEKEKKSSM